MELNKKLPDLPSELITLALSDLEEVDVAGALRELGL